MNHVWVFVSNKDVCVWADFESAKQSLEGCPSNYILRETGHVSYNVYSPSGQNDVVLVGTLKYLFVHNSPITL